MLAAIDMTAVAALITAVFGAALAVVSQVRSTRAEKIKREADNAMNTASGVSVGLTYLQEALKEYRDQAAEDRKEIRGLQEDRKADHQRITALERDVMDCHRERDALKVRLAGLEGTA